MAKIKKNELIATTNLVKEHQFEARNSHNLRKMHEAAEQGENYVIFDEMDLSNEFIMWLYKEKFRVCGLNDTEFKNFWEYIDDPNYVGAYRTIRISWES